MINFIICEDESILCEKYKHEIDKFMMQYDIDYKCHIYKGYTESWKEYAQKEDGFKIYILDIKTENGSGLDAARLIREEYDDWVSMIIIITAYSQYKYDALGKRLMLVDFINKLDNCSENLHKALSICMKNYDKRPKTLRYVYKNIAYNIALGQINYIEKELDMKRCIIKTTSDEFYIPGSLNNVMKKLDNRFIKCSRSTIVNTERIESYNIKTNVITFKDKETLDAVSRDKRKEVINHVRGIY